MKNFLASLTIQAPANKLIARKCNQKISKIESFENKEYRSSKPKYKLKLLKILPLKYI